MTINEQKEMKGGGANLVVYFIVGAIIVVLIGVLDGYLNPKNCNGKSK